MKIKLDKITEIDTDNFTFIGQWQGVLGNIIQEISIGELSITAQIDIYDWIRREAEEALVHSRTIKLIVDHSNNHDKDSK